jgi:hypothetical protein
MGIWDVFVATYGVSSGLGHDVLWKTTTRERSKTSLWSAALRRKARTITLTPGKGTQIE